MAGMIGGLYDFIVATFGMVERELYHRVCSAGEMLAVKGKIGIQGKHRCRRAWFGNISSD